MKKLEYSLQFFKSREILVFIEIKLNNESFN